MQSFYFKKFTGATKRDLTLTNPRRTGFRQLAEKCMWHLHGIPKGKQIGTKVHAETDQLRRG